jgi:hypothetical protein
MRLFRRFVFVWIEYGQKCQSDRSCEAAPKDNLKTIHGKPLSSSAVIASLPNGELQSYTRQHCRQVLKRGRVCDPVWDSAVWRIILRHMPHERLEVELPPEVSPEFEAE